MKIRKRLLDFFMAAALAVIMSPVILFFILAIRVSSKGPSIFSQTRVGRNGALFRCHKLRTMYLGTPSLPAHETSADAVTTIGKFLRRSHLDELPQLWNVLKGELSLVGPRPCLPTQIELIELRRQLGVLSAVPGITGLAQIQGIDMSNPRLCAETDAAYIKAASIGFDLRIMLGTLWTG